MKITRHNAPNAPQTNGRYAQAVEVTGASRWVYISGQVGSDATGNIPDDFGGQCRQVFRNLEAQLRAAGMAMTNVVKLTLILKDLANRDQYRAIRQDVMGDHQVASTAIVADLFDDRWQLEIEAIAAD